jgi:dihydrolipoamide dehydrogenase
MERSVDVAIIGAGTSGLNALAQVRKAQRSFVLINGGDLGTTCARVGCMPSKAFIQVAEDYHRREVFARHGIQGDEALSFNMAEAMEHVRDMRDLFVDRVLGNTTDELGEELIEGYARFVEPNVLEVDGHTLIRARRSIIATGSRPIVPPAWEGFREHILTTDELFEQESFPGSVAVIGLGIIGLELGQALHRFGIQMTGLDRLDTLGLLDDPAIARSALEILGKEFPIWLGAPAEITREGKRLRVSAGERSVVVDKVLASLGRRPNLARLGLEALGAPLDGNGVPVYDPHTMQVGDLPIFLAGDITGDRPILHEAGDEGRIAGYNASHDPILRFRRKTPLAITFCDPNIVSVGASWAQLQERDDVVVGEMRMGPVGRALIMAKNKGMLRVYADQASGRLLGAAMIAPRGENLGHLLAWSIQQNLSVFDLLKMPYYHPVIEEALQAALYDLAAKVRPQDAPLLELDVLV